MISRVLALVSILFLTASCGATWQRLHVNKLSYGDLFRLTSHVIDSDGFVIDEANPNTGEIITEWSYGKVVDVGRFPIRRRVVAQVDPDDEGYEIRLVVEQEALWDSHGVSDPRKEDDWEFHPRDKKKAFQIMTHIRLFVEEFKPSDEFYERYKRMDLMKDTIPDVLEEER